MFSLIKHGLILFLSFSSSLATKCLPLNNEQHLLILRLRPTHIALNPVELKYYPFMISLDKFSGSCTVLSP